MQTEITPSVIRRTADVASVIAYLLRGSPSKNAGRLRTDYQERAIFSDTSISFATSLRLKGHRRDAWRHMGRRVEHWPYQDTPPLRGSEIKPAAPRPGLPTGMCSAGLFFAEMQYDTVLGKSRCGPGVDFREELTRDFH